MVAAERLQSLSILKGISRSALDGLAREMVLKTYSKGDVVIEEGSLSGALFLIAKGTVSVQKSLGQADERVKVVARLGVEEFFGEMSFLENKPHSATIKAEEDAEILMLPRETLNELIKTDPKLALEQILTLLSGVSSRLRATTRELVTVFEVARIMSSPAGVEELIPTILRQVQRNVGDGSTVAFYRWNMFNAEFDLVAVEGAAGEIFRIVPVLDAPAFVRPRTLFEEFSDLEKSTGEVVTFPFRSGHLIVSHSAMENTLDGLFVYYSEAPRSFSPGQKQLMETISAVLAPALATARNREEELARQRLKRNREGFSI